MQVKKYILILTLSCFTSSCAFIQVGSSVDFNRYSTSGQLQPGMLGAEVRRLIGTPKNVATRRLQTDTRSVWTYKQPILESPGAYLILGIITFGIIFLFPARDSERHYLVFSNDVLIGWDLPDPYAPDLIIEKRLR